MKEINEDEEIKKIDPEEIPTSTFNIKELLWVCLSKWYIYVISLAITFGYAMYYVAKTPKTYVSTAALIIKDNIQNSGAAPDISTTFSDLASFNTNVNINNEMITIKSPVIVKEVVKRMGLDVNYMVKYRLRHNTLFGSTLPVTVKFIDLGDNYPAKMQIAYNGDGTVDLSHFTRDMSYKIDELPENTVVKVDLDKQSGDSIMTPLGRIIVSRNPAYAGDPSAKINEILIERIGLGAAEGRVSGSLTAEVVDNYSSVMHIHMSDDNTERANATLQTILDVYNENWLKDRNQISVSTSNFINERLAVIESELGDVDTDISAYKSEHLIPNISDASSAYFARALSASDEVAALSNTIALARQVRDHLSNIANAYEVLPATTGLGNVGIEGQIGVYNTKLIERNSLVANSSENNPVVIDKDHELAGMRKAILSAIDSYINTLNNEIAGVRSRQSISASHLSASPSQARHLLTYERQQKVKEQLYLYLLQKREENELSQAFTAYNTKIVMPPTPSGPTSPDSQNIYMVALLVGLIVPTVLIYLREMLNSKVRGRRDINRLTLPFVGEIPYTGKKESLLQRFKQHRSGEEKPLKVFVNKGSANIINEAFRVIRTNLEFMIPQTSDNSHVMMITSFNPGSGKSFISINLSIVLSLKGKRVALLDLDLRKATLSEAIGTQPIGLSNYLAGTAEASQIVIRDVLGNPDVDLFPVGPLPPNPAELLYSERLDELVKQLREEYDYVIIDCPPAEVVADSRIINRLVDLTIFVVRAGLLERSMLHEIQQFYNEGRYNRMALILNGTADISGRLNRGNRYGYGYGYGYGYVHKKKRKQKS